jgi:hypothetical protein
MRRPHAPIWILDLGSMLRSGGRMVLKAFLLSLAALAAACSEMYVCVAGWSGCGICWPRGGIGIWNWPLNTR